MHGVQRFRFSVLGRRVHGRAGNGRLRGMLRSRFQPMDTTTQGGERMSDELENAKPLVLKWAWRHYSLYMDEFDSVETALRMAAYQSDAGNEALDCIEVWDIDGYRTLTMEDVYDYEDEQAKRRAAEYEASPPEPFLATISIVPPEGSRERRPEWYGGYRDEESLATAIERLASLGNRVVVSRKQTDE